MPEIVDKFQQFLIEYGECIIERVQELVPGLAPEEQQNVPIMQSDNVFATCLVRADSKICSDHPSAPYTQLGVIYKVDVSAKNGIASISDFQNLGRAADDGMSYTEELTQRLMNDINDWFTTEHFFIHPLQSGHCYFKFQTYNPNMMLSLRYGDPEVESTEQAPIRSIKRDNTYVDSNDNLCYVLLNAVEYSIDMQGKVQTTIDSFYMIQTEYILHGLKGYPVIMNCDNDYYINKYITDNGAVNNYTDTYTTPQGKIINVYYGDNYIITNVQDNEPVSYNDVKNALNIAVNQINDDNDIDLNVPDYPVPPDPIESDNQEDGGNYNHAEFTKVYACTSAELNDLYQWMGGGAAGSSGDSPVTVPNNFDPMNRIVGLIGYPMIIEAGVGDQTTFTFRNAANQTINTGWSTYKYANFDRAFNFGTVTIPNWEELENGAPFLDYSATVEIYIPFCGIVGLDPQAVMGCTLSCKMWIDFVTGDCSAVVYTNYGGEDAQHPVAFVSGNCGSAEVVSANAFGAYQGAKAQASHKMSQAIIGGFKDLATSVIGGATTGFTRGAANPSGAGGSAGMRAGAIGSVIGGAMNLGVNLTLQNMDNRYAVQVAKNALGTTISGSFGQQTSWYYMDTPYIKVTWPTPISKDVELYGKTFGVPVHRSGALNEFTGYTVCNNVDVSGIAGATASELAIIKQFLETGVFIKEGGEE